MTGWRWNAMNQLGTYFLNGVWKWEVMDCGGKRSATPLWIRPAVLVVHTKALSPLRSASAVQKLPPVSCGGFSEHLTLETRR
jgi:hypothetical protein